MGTVNWFSWLGDNINASRGCNTAVAARTVLG